MASIRNKLLTDYAKHYERVNITLDPNRLSRKRKADFNKNYRRFINSLPNNSKVLDLGCGTGLFISLLKQYGNIIPIGVDISAEQASIARNNNPEIDIICDDALNYVRRFQNEFAAIFLLDLLEHLPNLEDCHELLNACYNALKLQGFIYVRTPNAANLTSSYSRYIDLTHERIFTSKSILQLLEASGFSRCEIVPIRSGHLTGKIRLTVEHLLHLIVFKICGRGLEHCFTSNVCAIGYKEYANRVARF